MQAEREKYGELAATINAISDAMDQGDTRLAHKLKYKVKELKKEHELLKREANERTYTEVNRMQHNEYKVDLHGMDAVGAREKVLKILHMFRSINSNVKIVLIIGRGNHSDGNVSRLGPVVKELLAEQGLPCTETMPGCLITHVQA